MKLIKNIMALITNAISVEPIEVLNTSELLEMNRIIREEQLNFFL